MDALARIDVSSIEELTLVRAEEVVLAERLLRMREMQSEVSPVVYGRVEGDYRARAAALEERARPLEERARAEYRRLATIHRRLADELEAARFDKEEQEFRHRIGELDENAFATQSRECEERLAERERAMSEADELRQRFVAAFRSEAELTRPEPDEPLVPAEPVEPAPMAAEAAPGAPDQPIEPSERMEDGVTRPFESPGEAPTLPPPPPAFLTPPADAAEDGTVILPWRGAAPTADPALAAAATMGATMVLPSARLVGQEEGLEQEFHLGPVTFVGRTSECQVRIARPAVSRRHARIELAPDGAHLITDLQSENGTYVNGVKVSEQRLADGDLVSFGTVRFLYKAT